MNKNILFQGLCLYEVITRKVPIPRKPVKMYAFDVEEFKSSMAPETSPVLFKLVCDCCQTEPRHRIPFKQILKNFNQIVDESSEDPIRWKVASIVGKKGITKTMQLKGKGQLKELLDDPEEGLIQKMTISRIESPNSTIKKTQSPNTSSSSQRPSLPSSRSSSSIPAFKASVDSMERHRGVTEVRNPKFQQSKPVVVNRDIKIGNQRTTSVSLGEAPMKKLSKEEEIRFFKACVDGDLPSLKSFLQGPMDLNILNRDGETPLFVAIKYGHLNVVELILPLMTTLQINTPTKNGSYSLHQACRVNQKAVVQMLLDAGAKLKIPDKQKNYPLHIACEIGSLDIVQLLLSKGGKSILETCNELGETPLLTSYRFCHRPIIAILHQNQANPWVVDRDGKTPLFYAVKQGDIELVRQLISVGCEIDHPTEG